MIALAGIAIQDKIYESSNSLVYRGIRDDGLEIVVKILKQNYPSPQELTSYRQEYEITRSLNLEGVIKAYSQQEYQRTLVILLEDFGGESLERWLRKRSDCCPMPLPNFLQLAINLIDILAEIHAANIIHKDINPGNIVLNRDTGVVKIIDFGIATQFNRTNPTFKSPHVLEGTLAYLSPEQTGRMNRLLDYRTDFYSLGATFYELLTGQVPFPTRDILELVYCHLAKPPISPYELNAKIPKPVSDIILKLMAKNAEDRYQSAWGIKADLEGCVYQLEISGQINSFRLGLQDISAQFQIPQKLYGREEEIAALLEAFERVAGRNDAEIGRRREENNNIPPSAFPRVPASSEMMLVSGYSGVGKSALVQELYKPITAKRGYFISGKFDQFQRNIPYSAIVDALRKLVQQLLGEPDDRVQQWRSRLLAALGNNGQLIVDVIPEVELIIGKQPPLPEVGSTEAQNRFNLVFQKFIRACCCDEYPLVVFLDDLQWIDSATLKLIELILSDREMQSLLLIGTYRDNEATQAHSLMATLEKLKQETVAINQIMLAPLELGAVAQLIAETLHTSTELIAPLAELICRRANGNPYFTNEFLKTLRAEDLIVFNVNQQCWQWDITQIKAKNITNNVVELMLGKLKQLPEQAQRVLYLAACVGAELDLATLSAICGRPAAEIFAELTTAIQSELILATSELDENLLIQNYKFSHDRVQQAAYALIAEEQQQAVHLRIGYLLLQSSEPEIIPHNLFRVVDHLNLGRNLVTDQQERDKLAMLNLLAGQRAKKTSAHNAALQYLATGIELLAIDSWQFQYTLTLTLHEEATEAAYLCGDFQQMEQWAIVVLEKASTVIDKIKVYETKIQNCMVQGRQIESIQIGLEVLELLGIALPKTPTEVDVQRQLKEAADYFDAINIEDLLELPLMQEPDKLAAMQILSSLVSATFQAAPSLLPLIVCEQINLSVRYGNTSFSTFAYAAYGAFILNGIVGDFEAGYQFGKLALSLTERLGSKKLEPKVIEMFAAHLMHCKAHIRQTLPRRKIAQLYMKEAHYCYERWGATAKVKDLETRYPQLFPQSPNVVSTPVRTTTGTISNTSHTALDLATVMKAAQAISSEIELERLLSSLMQILIENAGVQTGCLVLENLGEWAIKVACELNEGEQVCATRVLRSIPIAKHLPETIIQYVIRTHESVILNDATREGNFINDPYIQRNQTQSLLCLPLQNQRKLIGVLYLENQLVSGAFTPERSQVLHLLSTQAAIAIKNAKLYSKLRASESQMTQFLEAIPVGIGIIDATGRPYYVNQRGIELMGKGVDPVATPEQIAEVYQFYVAGTDQIYPTEKMPIIRALSGERTTIDDIEIRQNNATIPSEVWGTPVFDEQGKVAYAIAAFQDITERRQAEHLLANYNRTLEQQVAERTAALQESEAALRHREQELRLITDALPVCISYVDANRRYCFVNRTYEKWFSRNRDQILGMHVREILGEKAYQVVEPYINQVFEGQTATLEVEMPLQSGKRYISTTLIPDLDGHAQVKGFYALNTDISDRKQSEEVLRQSEAQFREQAILSAFRADVDNALAQNDDLPSMLHRCAEAVVKHFNAAFARIWTLNKDKNVLELQASAGMYNRLDGTYSRVPVGSFKVGRIAQDRCPLLTNNVFDEPSIDKEWAEREGMVAFAGYPILLDEQLVGVIAMFTRHPIPLSNFGALEFASREIGLGIKRKQAEVALQASEAELRALFSAMPDPLMVVDAEGRILRAILIESEKLYKSIDEQVGRTLHEIFEQSQADIFLGYIRQALSTQQPLTVEYSLMMGEWKTWFATRISPISEHSVIWLARDITDRKRAEAATILEERNRMAREIHDTLAQSFTGILLHVGAATELIINKPATAQSHLETVDELARTGLAEARRSVAALRPKLLEEGDLFSALKHLTTQMTASTDTHIICEVTGAAYALSPNTENNLLRIGQEALTNAIKYAHATEIHIELVYEEMQCLLRVKDDGQGFEVAQVYPTKGFGLLGMSERVEQIGGELIIHSQPSQGTEVIVIVNRE